MGAKGGSRGAFGGVSWKRIDALAEQFPTENEETETGS